jgi:hypothetical protein
MSIDTDPFNPPNPLPIPGHPAPQQPQPADAPEDAGGTK